MLLRSVFKRVITRVGIAKNGEEKQSRVKIHKKWDKTKYLYLGIEWSNSIIAKPTIWIKDES